jgi:hypothetical protein
MILATFTRLDVHAGNAAEEGLAARNEEVPP